MKLYYLCVLRREVDMDKRKGILNISVSVTLKIVTTALQIVVRRLLIESCGNEVNGLNALFLSIIGFLAVAELGVGVAISFCMYKPIVEGNDGQVSALYHLFQRLYLLIGAIILLGGLMIAPFMRYFARDYADLDVGLSTNFILMLVSVVLSYLFASKTALINAYKNNYITTAISSGGIVLQQVLQIIVLVQTGSYSAFLCCRIIAVLVQWGGSELVAFLKYRQITMQKATLDEDTKHNLTRSVKAMFIHNVGSVMVNTVDSVVISACIGIVALGCYSNYSMIMEAMTGVIILFFSSLTSIIGHLYVQQDRETSQKICETMQVLNFCIGMVFYLGYYAIIDDLIMVLFSPELVDAGAVSLVVALNGFVQFMRRNALTFREATGTFYYDRWKPLLEGACNVVLSVLLVHWFGVVGVIGATIVTNLLICHVIEPYMLYKHAFGEASMRYCFRTYGLVAVFLIGVAVMELIRVSGLRASILVLVNGSLSVLISGVICVLVIMLYKYRGVDIRILLKKSSKNRKE